MPDDINISIQFVNPRPAETICGWLTDPKSLLAKLTQHLVVPGEKLNQKQFFVYSAAQPGQDDQDKIWVKTSNPYGIGFFAGGGWQVSYATPPTLIYAQSATDDVPLGFQELTQQQMESIGLPRLTGGRYVRSK